MGGKDFFPSL